MVQLFRVGVLLHNPLDSGKILLLLLGKTYL